MKDQVLSDAREKRRLKRSSDKHEDKTTTKKPKTESLSPKRSPNWSKISLKDLILHDVVIPGEDVLKIDYMRKSFSATLTPSGLIEFNEGNGKITRFESLSSWSIFCKRLINPSRQADDGWHSVKYNGLALMKIKENFIQKCSDNLQEELLSSSSESELSSPRSESTQISFDVNITTKCLIMADFHTHLSKKSVCGLLAGSWNKENQSLTIVSAFPNKITLSKLGTNSFSEQFVSTTKQKAEEMGLNIVGCYRSLSDTDQANIIFNPSPSDIPTVCITIDPKNSDVSRVTCYVGNSISPNSQTLEFSTETSRITKEVVTELNKLVSYYKGLDERVNLKSEWRNGLTSFDKLRTSMSYWLFSNRKDGQRNNENHPILDNLNNIIEPLL